MVSVKVTGLDALITAIRSMGSRAEAATPAAVAQAAALLEGKARANLSRYSHAPRTPTPSPPGEPPALVTGRLRSSFDILGPTSAGAGAWAAVIGPTTAYARIQELGGTAGRGHHAVLPPRPYLRPAYDALVHDPELLGVFARTWLRAVNG
ncbi:HK97 gp10 family phage protein [Streptomyces olivoreticuli]